MTEYVLRTGKPLLATPDVYDALVARGEVELIGAPSIDWVGAPLTIRDRTIGVVAAQTYSEGVRYQEQDKDILTFVSSQIAMAVERKRADDTLRTQTDLLGQIVENIPVMLAFLDPEGRHVTWGNREWTRVLGYTVDDTRQSEERYRAFIEQSSEGVSRLEFVPPVPVGLPEEELVDRIYESGILAECNDAMARMYGFPAARDMIGTRLVDLHDRTDPSNRQQILALVRSGFRQVDSETHEHDREGHPRVFLNNVVGFVEGDHLVRVWGSQRDVTEQRRLEEQFRQAQ